MRSHCPDCGALSNFVAAGSENRLRTDLAMRYYGRENRKASFHFLKCSGCGRGGMARVWHIDRGDSMFGDMDEFHPRPVRRETLPSGVPHGVLSEYREAEYCAALGARRAAVALYRSALEKSLRANGYTKKHGNLLARIDLAAADGVIAAARRQRAHHDVRLTGNDVLHDPWREVGADETEAAAMLVHRLIEDLYGDRETVEAVLAEKGRLADADPAEQITDGEA